MATVFFILFLISLAAVVISLVAGVLTMGRPGENARRRSSLLMWSRIVSQAGVVVFLLLYLWLR